MVVKRYFNPGQGYMNSETDRWGYTIDKIYRFKNFGSESGREVYLEENVELNEVIFLLGENGTWYKWRGKRAKIVMYEDLILFPGFIKINSQNFKYINFLKFTPHPYIDNRGR